MGVDKFILAPEADRIYKIVEMYIENYFLGGF